MKTGDRGLGTGGWGTGSARLALGAATVLLCLLPTARAQFALSVVNGSTETPVTSLYNFGAVSTGDSVSAQFRIRNTSNAAANLTLLKVAGAGFTLSGGPSLPQKLNPQDAINFIISFQASTTGGYSATLSADGISAFLTASVVPGLTYQVQTASGNQNLGGAPVDFGSVQVGQTMLRHFMAINGTQQALTVPPISVAKGDFSLSGASPSGVVLQAGQQAGLDLQFQPSAAGARTGTLTVGSQTFSLIGTGTAAPLPQPKLTISLAQPQSALPQGSVTVNFDSPAATSGSGVLTLQFQPSAAGASDPAIAFSLGGQSVSFTFTAGDIQATFGSQRSVAFQIGTTAGTISFTAQIGSLSDQQSITIAPAVISFTATQANRSPASLSVQVTGFDNTRTAGHLTFAFYDALGNLIAPGAIPADATSAFAQYFAGSAGGSFLLTAVFPVTGDSSTVTYVQAAFTNSAGTSTTVRTSFQ